MTIIVYLFNTLTLLVQYISNNGLRSLRGLRTQVVKWWGGLNQQRLYVLKKHLLVYC